MGRVHRTRDLVLLAVLILGSGVVIGAGGVFLAAPDKMIPPPMPPRLDPIVGIMKDDYGLTDEQVEAIRPAFAKHFEQMWATWKENEQKMADIRTQLDKDLQEVLTPEQFAKWREKVEQLKRDAERWQRGRGDHRQGPGGPGGPGDWRRGEAPGGGGRGPSGGRAGGTGRGPGAEGRSPAMMLLGIAERLEDLTDEQRAQIEAVAKKAEEEFAGAGDDPDRRRIISESVSEMVMEVLTEPQRQRVREMQERIRQGRAVQRGAGGPNDVPFLQGPAGDFGIRPPNLPGGMMPLRDANSPATEPLPQPTAPRP